MFIVAALNKGFIHSCIHSPPHCVKIHHHWPPAALQTGHVTFSLGHVTTAHRVIFLHGSSSSSCGDWSGRKQMPVRVGLGWKCGAVLSTDFDLTMFVITINIKCITIVIFIAILHLFFNQRDKSKHKASHSQRSTIFQHIYMIALRKLYL